MAIIKSTVRVGEKPPTEVLLRLREARNYPVNLEACPEAAPEALREFAAMAAERSRRGRRQAVTIRLPSGSLAQYKALGKGYTGVMADILTRAANNPGLLAKTAQS